MDGEVAGAEESPANTVLLYRDLLGINEVKMRSIKRDEKQKVFWRGALSSVLDLVLA